MFTLDTCNIRAPQGNIQCMLGNHRERHFNICLIKPTSLAFSFSSIFFLKKNLFQKKITTVQKMCFCRQTFSGGQGGERRYFRECGR